MASQPAFIVNGAEIVVASAVVAADRTGRQDATAAIQRALDDVGAARGGVVFLHAGRYLVEGSLAVPYGTTLMGESVNNFSKGTVLLARNRQRPLLDARGTESGLVHLTVWYPGQNAGQVTAYPPTVAGGGSLTIRDLTLCNSYDGIFLESANACVIENVRGTVLHRGIVAPESEEFSWMHDVHFSNAWWRKAAAAIAHAPLTTSQSAAVDAFTRENLVGLELQRIDCMAIYHYAADNAATAVLLEKNPKFPDPVFGFGGVVADFQGQRAEEGWAPWYYYMHYANLDNVPEAKGKRYRFAGPRHARVTTANSFFDVALPPYSARGDGRTDDTDAIQRALADAAQLGGGTVYLRQGEYKITAPLVVPSGVELRGPLGAGQARAPREICTLAVYGGKDAPHPETDPAAITLMSGAGVRGFAIAHPEQEYDARRLRRFPYAIRGAGADVWIVDMLLLNSFNGIDLASARCDRHLVQGVWGTVFRNGVNVGGNSAGGKLERVTFSCGPWTEAFGRLSGKASAAGKAAVEDYLLQNNTAFSFGDCAGETGWGLCAFEPHVHFHFYAENGRGCRDASFWESMHDMAQQCNVLADAGSNIKLFGYFGTGTGGNKFNWLETGPTFKGPLNVYAKTILRNFHNHPWQFTGRQARLYDEISLTTGKRASATGTLAGSNPASAVDRDCRTLWEAAAGGVLEVDLGQTKTINRFGIQSAGLVMSVNRNTLEAELWTSDDDSHFRRAAILKTGGASWADLPVAPLRARYVQLRVTQPGADAIIRVASFDVFGSED